MKNNIKWQWKNYHKKDCEILMELIGEIEDVIYYNETNSYMIAEFDTEEEQTTIVGYLPFIGKGDSLKVIGNFVEHKNMEDNLK